MKHYPEFRLHRCPLIRSLPGRLLLRRAILDAGKRCPTLLAEITEPLGERDGPSAGCRNLLRAGFRQASVRMVWRRG